MIPRLVQMENEVYIMVIMHWMITKDTLIFSINWLVWDKTLLPRAWLFQMKNSTWRIIVRLLLYRSMFDTGIVYVVRAAYLAPYSYTVILSYLQRTLEPFHISFLSKYLANGKMLYILRLAMTCIECRSSFCFIYKTSHHISSCARQFIKHFFYENKVNVLIQHVYYIFTSLVAWWL